MRKSFRFLIYLVLLGSCVNHSAAQTTNPKSNSVTNLNKPQSPITSATVTASVTEPNAKAKEFLERGTKRAEAGQFSEALEDLQQALKLQPDYADAYSALGRVYFKLEQWQKAIDNLHRAVALNKERQRQESLQQKMTSGRPEDGSALVRTTPESRKETTTQPATNVNPAALKAPAPTSINSQQQVGRNEPISASKPTTTSSQNKTPQTNFAVGGVTTSTSRAVASQIPNQRTELGPVMSAAPASFQIKPPQASIINRADAKTSAFKPGKSEQTEQPKQSNSPSNLISTSSESKPASEPKPDVPVVKTTAPEIAQQSEQRKESSTQAKSTATTQRLVAEVRTRPSVQIKPLQESNVNPDAKTSAFKPGKSEQTEQPKQSNSPSNLISISSESKPASETKPNVPVVKTTAPEIAQQSEQQKGGSTQAKSNVTTQKLAAEVSTPSPESETGRPPLPQVEQPGVAVKPILSHAETKPQQAVTATGEQTETNDAKKATAQDVTTSPRNSGVSQEGGGSPQKLDAVGAEVSINAKAESSPPETRNAIPNSINSSPDEASLTRIYRVGPNDVLDIRINDTQTARSTLFTVTPSGLLEHPVLSEPLLVTGFTAEEIRSKIENEVIRRALIDNPDVAVGVREYASHSIIVSGLVKDSGTRFLRREAIPLYVVVADAQPLPEAARATVVRHESNQIYEIDLTHAAEMNLLVRPGDVITLHPNVTQFVYIGGEVKFPGERTFRRGLTLTQAIISSGATAKAKVAEIARDDGRGFLVEKHFNLKEIQSGKAVDPLLRPGDRITILR